MAVNQARPSAGILPASILITLGVLLFANNIGFLPEGSWQNILLLWPVVLILAGVSILLRRLPVPLNAVLSVVAVLLTVAGSVAFVLSNPLGRTTPATDEVSTSSAPIGGLTSASLVTETGSIKLMVEARDLGDKLYEVSVGADPGQQVSVAFDPNSGRVLIRQNWRWFSGPTARVTIHVSNRVPWSIELDGGATSLDLQGESLKLERLQASGGAFSGRLHLGRPVSTTTLDFEGGANTVQFSAPAGTQLRIDLQGGANHMIVDGEGVGRQERSTIGELHWQTSGYNGAESRYQLLAGGGANTVRASLNGQPPPVTSVLTVWEFMD